MQLHVPTVLRPLPLVLAAGLAPAATADVLRVPAEFPTIQAAIDAAVAGDEVLVAPGVYAETIDFDGKAIAVRSETGATRTVVDGGGASIPVVLFDSGEGPESRIEGFTITGAVGASGVRVVDASPVLAELVIAGNDAGQGGGMSVSGGAPRVVGSLFVGNTSSFGGGLYALFSDLVLENVRFEGNDAGYGGGLAADGGTLRMDACGFFGNTSTQFGGGLYMNHVQVDAVELVAEGNGEAEFLPDGTTIFSTFGGGGMYTTDTSGRIDRSIFRDNVAFAGGGVYIAGSGTLELVNCLSAENNSGVGGGVYTNGSSPSLINCTVARNFPGGLFSTFVSFPKVRNSILAENGNDVYISVDVYGNGTADLAWTRVGEPVLVGGELGVGTSVGDPLLGPDFELLASSPAIDAGDNTAVPAGVKLDLDGAPRFVDDPATRDGGVGPAPIVDLGALEYAPPLPLHGRQ